MLGDDAALMPGLAWGPAAFTAGLAGTLLQQLDLDMMHHA